MIIPMTKYSFLLLSADKETFLDKLQDLGVVDITRSAKAVDDVSRGIVSEIEAIKADIKNIGSGSDARTESLKARRDELQRSLEEAAPWGEYDREKLKALGVKFYCISAKSFRKEWEESYAIQTVHETKDKIWFAIAGDSEGFPVKDIPLPQRNASDIQAELDETVKALDEEKKQLESRIPEIPGLEKKVEDLYNSLNVYLAGVSGQSAAEDSLLIYQGFAPTSEDARLKSEFDSMDVYYIAEKAVAADNPPIELKNNSFSKQFEVLTKMYGVPVYNEFDPTVFLSIFFLLFFAMCLGDAGYGLALIVIGFFLRRKKGGLANMWSLIVSLGFGTLVVGFLMGGFFGVNLVEVPWIPDWMKKFMIVGDISVGNATYAKWMIISLMIGIVHICLAMVTKAVWAVKRDGFKNSLGTLGWTLLIVGGIIGLSVGLTGVISEALMKWLLIGIAAVSALGIFIFNKWGRNPLVNIGTGLWDTYNTASGLISDVLSYIRLYALGLSGSMLASTFNQIAEMVKGPDPTWQWVPFVLILLFGHVLNLGLSCLGAFVHPLRLNFLEFFKNSGYEGAGVEYKPIKR